MHKQEPSQGHMEGHRVTHTYSCLLVRPHLQALPDCETEHVMEVVGKCSFPRHTLHSSPNPCKVGIWEQKPTSSKSRTFAAL